jgi:predicted porin
MRYLTALLVVAALGATEASAQPAPWEPERLTAGWTFVPALGVGGLWDSNSTLRSTGDPQLRQWVGVVNPRGELNFNGRRSRFVFGYSGSLEAYNTLKELTRYDQRGRLQAQYKATPRLQLRVQSALSVSPTTERLELGGLPFENVGSALYDARGGMDYSLSQRTSVTADYEFQWIEFDRDAPTPGVLSGGRSNSAIGTLRHAFTSRINAGGVYTYRLASTEGRVRNVRVQDALGVATLRVAENTSVEAGVGLAYLKIRDTGETRTGPSLRASLRHGLSRSRVELAYEKSFIPSWTFGGTTTNEEVRATLHVPFASGRAFLQGTGAYRHNEPLTSSGDQIRLDSWWTGASVGYHFAPWIRVEGYYSGSFQASSARGEVDRTRVGIQFVTLKPVRIQ